MFTPVFYALVIQLTLFSYLNIDLCSCYQFSEREVIRQLLTNYEPASRPVKLGNETLEASVQVILQQVVDLDEKNQILLTSLLVQLKWIDQTIKHRMLQLYKHSEFEDRLTSLVLPSSRVWTPDLYVYNNADDGKNGLLDVRQSRVRVSKGGEVTWNLPVSVRSSCNVDVLYFPFDHQMCDIQLASWTYDQSQLKLNIVPVNTSIMLSKLIENVELAVPELKIYQDYRITVGGQNITQINLRIHIYRRALFYAYTVIAPSILLCVLTIFSFWLPSGNARKIDMGLTVFLFLYFLQVMIAENTPESNSTPLIGTFLTMVMTLNSISLIFATTVLHIHLRSKSEPCPEPHPLLWLLVTKVLGYLAMVPYTGEIQIDSNVRCEQVHNGVKSQAKINLSNNTDKNRKALVEENNSTRSSFVAASRDNPENIYEQYNQTSVLAKKQTLKEVKIARWLYIARVVDRILFQVYLITTLISIFVFLIYLPASYDKKI
ncbi:unnamed protein product [Trichobilharzia szidati]|nr:unnamed protein product [Trichobilharzia szidati]